MKTNHNTFLHPWAGGAVEVALFVCLLVCCFPWRNHLRLESKQRSIWSRFSLLRQIRKKLDFNPNRSHFALATCCGRAQHGTPASAWQLCLSLPDFCRIAAAGSGRCCCWNPLLPPWLLQGARGRESQGRAKAELDLKAGPESPPWAGVITAN